MTDTVKPDWTKAAAAVRWNVRPFVDGSYRHSRSLERFANINPANETTLCEVAVGDARDVDEAVGVARRRFNDGVWSDLPPATRGAILLRLADLVVQHRDEIALLDTLEMGKPIQSALFDAEVFAPYLLRAWAGFADKLRGEMASLAPTAALFNAYEPRGVVGAIIPWNYPIICAVYKIGPALAAGNTMVLKPSELTSSSALRLAELALEAGVPAGVLNVVPGLGSTVGAALARHRDVDMLSFTGSTATGRKLLEMSGASNGKPVLMECGGKSPQVVFSDVEDLDAVADVAAQAILVNQGQVCAAHTRLIAHERIKDALLEKVIARARGQRPADPLNELTTFGPLASPAQRSRVNAYIEQGLSTGAEAVLRGTVQQAGGCYVSPTIFDRVDSTMSIVREEIFGPVLTVQSFKTDDEAIVLANATEYGLAATVWTQHLGRAKRVAHSIRAGYVSIRTGGKEGADLGLLSLEPQKSSGFGCELGLGGLKSYSTLKCVSLAGN